MILKGTILKTADNSGAFIIKVIHVYNNNMTNKIGSLIKSVPYSFTSRRRVQKKKKYKVILVNQAFPIKRRNGTRIKWSTTRGVVLNENGDKLLGSRVFGPVDRRLKYYTKLHPLTIRKIISLSTAVI